MKSELKINRPSFKIGELVEYTEPKGFVVLITSKGFSDSTFEGIVVYTFPNSEKYVGEQSKYWTKDKFNIFSGKLEISN